MFKCLKRKYELTGRTVEYNGVTLHQIRALRSIPEHGIRAGDYGGYIQNYHNLSQLGSCWVGDRAKVFDCAKVKNNAVVYATAVLCQFAKAIGNSIVCGEFVMSGHAKIMNRSEAYEHAKAGDFVKIKGRSLIHGDAHLYGDCKIISSNIRDVVDVYAKAVIVHSDISGDSTICGKAYVCEETLRNVIRR